MAIPRGQLLRLYPGPRPVTLDGNMLAAIGVLFTTATGAIGWLFTKVWARGDDAQAKLLTMLERQFDDAGRRKDLFDNMGKTVDGLGQSVKDLGREVAALRTDIQRIRP